jgi:hypothetical protein
MKNAERCYRSRLVSYSGECVIILRTLYFCREHRDVIGLAPTPVTTMLAVAEHLAGPTPLVSRRPCTNSSGQSNPPKPRFARLTWRSCCPHGPGPKLAEHRALRSNRAASRKRQNPTFIPRDRLDVRSDTFGKLEQRGGCGVRQTMNRSTFRWSFGAMTAFESKRIRHLLPGGNHAADLRRQVSHRTVGKPSDPERPARRRDQDASHLQRGA